MKSIARAGHVLRRRQLWCLVHWRRLAVKNETGRVEAWYTDRAGNIGSNSLQTPLRDRVPPKLGRTNAHWTRRGRLFVNARCTGGPGRISVQYGADRKNAGATTFQSSATMVMHRAFPKVTRRTTFIHVICSDKSANAVDTWLFLPR